MSQGWIKTHRELLNSDLWLSEKFTRGQAWLEWIGLANHKTGFIIVRGNKIPIQRGQVGWSEVRLSERWGWSRNKVRRFLYELKTEQQIEQQKNYLSSVITITDYEIHQSNGQQTEQQMRQQKDSRRNTNKNGKNEKKGVVSSPSLKNNYQRPRPPLNTKVSKVVKEFARGWSLSTGRDYKPSLSLQSQFDLFRQKNTQYSDKDFIVASSRAGNHKWWKDKAPLQALQLENSKGFQDPIEELLNQSVKVKATDRHKRKKCGECGVVYIGSDETHAYQNH